MFKFWKMGNALLFNNLQRLAFQIQKFPITATIFFFKLLTTALLLHHPELLLRLTVSIFETFCAIWYHLYNLKKNTHGGVLHIVNFTKNNPSPWVFFTFYHIAQSITFVFDSASHDAILYSLWLQDIYEAGKFWKSKSRDLMQILDRT